MSDFKHYMHMQDVTKWRKEASEAASANLTIARIKERLAEIRSQHEPLNGLSSEKMTERDRCIAAAFYVVIGRMPTINEVDKEPQP